MVEHRKQTVAIKAWSMLKVKNMPDLFWGEALGTVVFILNRSYTCNVDGKTSYEVSHRRKLDVHYLRVLGCIAHVKVTRLGLKNLDDYSEKMVLIDYEPGSKAYRVYDLVEKCMYTTCDMVFDEGAS